MNPSTVIGAAVGLLTLIIVVALSATNPGMYFNLPGLAIVLGGTCAALFIAYPLSEVVRVFAGAHRVPQRPARPAARHRRAGEHGPAVDEHRRAQGRTGAEEGLEPLPAHRRAAHHRQHPGRPDHRAVAMARGAAARARTGRGADVPRHGHLRPGLRHAGHAGGPDQPDGHPGRRQHADHRPAAGDRPDDHVLRHPAGQPGVQAHRGQAGAPHRPPRRIHEHGAARHRHDVREARPGRRARDPQFLRHARRGRDL